MANNPYEAPAEVPRERSKQGLILLLIGLVLVLAACSGFFAYSLFQTRKIAQDAMRHAMVQEEKAREAAEKARTQAEAAEKEMRAAKVDPGKQKDAEQSPDN